MKKKACLFAAFVYAVLLSAAAQNQASDGETFVSLVYGNELIMMPPSEAQKLSRGLLQHSESMTNSVLNFVSKCDQLRLCALTNDLSLAGAYYQQIDLRDQTGFALVLCLFDAKNQRLRQFAILPNGGILESRTPTSADDAMDITLKYNLIEIDRESLAGLFPLQPLVPVRQGSHLAVMLESRFYFKMIVVGLLFLFVAFGVVRYMRKIGAASRVDKALLLVCSLSVYALSFSSFAGGTALKNPPSECKAADSACGCATGEGASDGCIKASLDMGATTPWTGSAKCALKVFADDQSPQVFTPESLFAVCGYVFKRVGTRLLPDGADCFWYNTCVVLKRRFRI